MKFVASPVQQQIWHLARQPGATNAYTVPLVWRLTGPLDQVRLATALDQVVTRHDILRTTFAEGPDGVEARVREAPADVLRVEDLSARPAEEAEEFAWCRIDAEIADPPSLTDLPLLRARLFRLGDRSAILLLIVHHIAFDARSQEIVCEDLSRTYRGLAPDRKAIDGAEAARRVERARRGELGELLEQWREELADVPAALSLPTDRPRPDRFSFVGDRRHFRLAARETTAIRRACRRSGVTPFVFLLSAYALTLAKVANQNDLVVGVPATVRDTEELDDIVGYLIDSLPIRFELPESADWSSIVKGAHRRVMAALSRREVPFHALVRHVNPDRQEGTHPLFQVMFSLQYAADHALELGPVTATPLRAPFRTAKFDLTLEMTDNGTTFEAALEYSADLFDAATVDAIVDRFRRVLETVLDHPEARLGDVSVLTPAEVEQLTRWSGDGAAVTGERVTDLLRTVVDERPDAIAVTASGLALSYADLWRSACALAHSLVDAGVGPGAVVGVAARRDAATVVAPLAVWLAGGVYLPLDPDYPAARLTMLLDDGGAQAVLVDQATVALPVWAGRPVIVMRPGERGGPAEAPSVPTTKDDAYLMYTSGSTGRPKGVLVGHGSLTNLLRELTKAVGLRRDDVVLAATTVTFDISLVELLAPLLVGGRCVVASDDEARQPVALAALVERDSVTCVQATPGVWGLLAGRLSRSVRLALCGGERMTGAIRDGLLGCSEQAFNVYGPTETTIWSSVGRVDGGPVRAGRPLPGNRFLILDRWGCLVPPGTTGDLHIAGGALARGYLNQPELTAAAFLPDDSVPGGRRYRTGDRARWDDDGRVELLGRTDDQVKVRGYRIEVGEIEHVVMEFSDVGQCAVVPVASAGMTSLAAFVAPDQPDPAGGATGINVAAIEEHVAARLPSYMVPVNFFPMPRLPLTPAGKVDRKALTAEAGARIRAAARVDTEDLPADLLESIVTGAFATTLGLPDVGSDQSFFRLGGDSLGAAIMLAGLSVRLGVDLGLHSLYQYPSARRLAGSVRGVGAALRPVVLGGATARGTIVCVTGSDQLSTSLRSWATRPGAPRVVALTACAEIATNELAGAVERSIQLFGADVLGEPAVVAGIGRTGSRLAMHVAAAFDAAGGTLAEVAAIGPELDHPWPERGEPADPVAARAWIERWINRRLDGLRERGVPTDLVAEHERRLRVEHCLRLATAEAQLPDRRPALTWTLPAGRAFPTGPITAALDELVEHCQTGVQARVGSTP